MKATCNKARSADKGLSGGHGKKGRQTEAVARGTRRVTCPAAETKARRGTPCPGHVEAVVYICGFWLSAFLRP